MAAEEEKHAEMIAAKINALGAQLRDMLARSDPQSVGPR
jgi:ferritin-like protein